MSSSSSATLPPPPTLSSTISEIEKYHKNKLGNPNRRIVISFYANRVNEKNSEIVSYHIKGVKHTQLTQSDESNIVQRKGRKEELEKAMAVVFEQSWESIEIGYVTLTKNGFEMHIMHHISMNELDHFNKTHQRYQDDIFKSYVKPQQYVKQLYKALSLDINAAFKKHFLFDDGEQFMVKYIDDYDRKTEIQLSRRRSRRINLTDDYGDEA